MGKIVFSSDWSRFKPGYPVQWDPFKDADQYYLDEKVGQDAVDFFPECLVHIKGPMALEPVFLELWQRSIIGHLFGWKHKKTHLRRFREAFLFLPRKQGKSLMVSGISLFSLFCSQERGQEIYCCASDRAQARIVFDTSKMMALKDGDLAKRAEVRRSEIRYPQRDSVFKVLSSEAGSKHGFNSSLVILDELHAIGDRELVDVLITSTGARKEPLVVSITTAGYDQTSICFEKYDYAKKVRDGVVQDPAFLPVIYESEEGADWMDEETWKKVNPNYGISITADYLTREAERAKESPAYEAVFRRLHLNQWTDASSPFISLEDWDKCGGSLPDLSGRPCYGGLDLSSTQDLTALSLCFPPQEDGEPYHLLSFGWIPEDTAKQNRRRPYLQWIRTGHLFMVPGAVIEYQFVIEKILQLREMYQIKAIMFDRWAATAVYQALEGEGVEMIRHGQGFKDQSPPTKELLRLVLAGKVRHGDHPVLRWCVSNLVVEGDPAGNVKPSRRRSTEKIDLAVSSIMSLAGCVCHEEEKPFVSIYDGLSNQEIKTRMAF